MKYACATDYWLDRDRMVLRGDFDGMYRDLADPWDCENSVRRLENRLFIELLREFGPYEFGVDIGCGLGGLASLIADSSVCQKMNGCDISAVAVDRARELHPSIEFRRWNVLTDELSPVHLLGRYDLVVMSEVLWYLLADLTLVFGKVRSLLTHSGLIGVKQYFPDRQRFWREVLAGESGFRAFCGDSGLRCLKRVVSHVDDGVVMMGVYRADARHQ